MYDTYHTICPKRQNQETYSSGQSSPGTVKIQSLKESEDIKLMCRITKKRELISTLTLNTLFVLLLW